MLVLHSYQSQSSVGQQRLLKRLRSTNSDIVGIEIALLYFLILKDDDGSRLSQELTGDYRFDELQIYKLLGINESDGGQSLPWQENRNELLYVVPRLGTISSWSSKATDIFRICNIDAVARVERGFCYRLRLGTSNAKRIAFSDGVKELLHDRMTEAIYDSDELEGWEFRTEHHEPGSRISPLDVDSEEIRLKSGPGFASDRQQEPRLSPEIISNHTRAYGKELGLSEDEILYLINYYQEVGHKPTDTEIMMYAQVNSEHCRHKLFNAHWLLDLKLQAQTLFEMIKSTRDSSSRNVLSAYRDNASVIGCEGTTNRLQIDLKNRYYYDEVEQPFLIKVETHNHPTAISPFAGAATGSGGEIRDESATGRGGRPRMGLVGFSLSNLHIPDFEQPWENPSKYPRRIATALQIITEGPIGAARFNNEFGRPCVCGYFRTYEQCDNDDYWGYHKPIMIAGGLGSIRRDQVNKRKFKPATPLVVFGGPAMCIGLGGGSASSVSGGSSSHDLDFASVQRDNAEMQRRCQEVIEQCTRKGNENPILSIHDVGAGGLANALPELVHDAGCGAHINLRAIPCADSMLLPMEIWCNESQERYVAAIVHDKIDEFLSICERERCPVAVVGKATADKVLVLEDTDYSRGTRDRTPINMPMSVLFAKPIRDERPLNTVTRPDVGPCKLQDIDLNDAVERVLKMPAVASKSFLITIGDRTVTGLICRDPMVGPWQVPVSDVAVSARDYTNRAGEAIAMGERTPVATFNASASGRLAVAEAVLNILAADVKDLKDICLSANWMVACALAEQRFDLYRTVQAVSELCKELQITIPVGKDSLSMQMQWQENGKSYNVNSPLSLIVSAFASVGDIKKTLTPQLNTESLSQRIFLIDISGGDNRLGGSCLMQAYNRQGDPPDLDNPKRLTDFCKLMHDLREHRTVLAYHDRSDGGLLTALIEMAFAANCGVCCELDNQDELLPALFSEAPGVLLQLSEEGIKQMRVFVEENKDILNFKEIASVRLDKTFEVRHKGQSWNWDLMQLKRWWSETSAHIQALRDDPQCAVEEMESICDADNPGLNAEWDFDLPTHFSGDLTTSFNINANKPKVAILREQGVNGQMEMAVAFERAGFAAYDIHINDLIRGETDLRQFQGLAACGGFSYGDVLGAGAGWAHSILLHDRSREIFEMFFNRLDTFTLGVCNGCQMLSRIKEIIPGASHWPTFERNRSDQFEARLVKVEIMPSPSVLLKEMDGARLPIVVAHGEGQLTSSDSQTIDKYTCLRYIDNYDRITEHYPENPNGSRRGATAFCTTDGRVTIMMPHPERLFRTTQYSWHPSEWGEVAPWFKLFLNAYRFCK